MDQEGKPRFEINGRWNEWLSIKNLATAKEDMVYKIPLKDASCEKIYGFSEFTCNLNYIDDEMKKTLPPTDSRRRGD